jgi:hypothetical protein
VCASLTYTLVTLCADLVSEIPYYFPVAKIVMEREAQEWMLMEDTAENNPQLSTSQHFAQTSPNLCAVSGDCLCVRAHTCAQDCRQKFAQGDGKLTCDALTDVRGHGHARHDCKHAHVRVMSILARLCTLDLLPVYSTNPTHVHACPSISTHQGAMGQDRTWSPCQACSWTSATASSMATRRRCQHR